MNSLKVFGKYLDQPRLVSRFSRAVPPLLSLAASGIVLDSTYRAPEDKRQKVFIRNGLTMFGAVASSLYAPKIISKMFRTAPKLVKSKELREYNTALVDEFVSQNRVSIETNKILQKIKTDVLNMKEIKTLSEELEDKELLNKLIPEPENISSKDIFSEIGRLSVFGLIPVLGGIAGGIAGDRLTCDDYRDKIPNKIKEGAYQYLANIFLCNIGAGAALGILEKMNIKWNYTNKIVNDLLKINRAREIVDLLEIPVSVEEEIKKETIAKRVHYSTKIEGNSLDLNTVKKIIENTNNSHERNALEVRNYYNALMYLNKEADTNNSITEDLIFKVHNLVIGKNLNAKATYRDGQNIVEDSLTKQIVYMPPEAKDIKALINQMIKEFDNKTSKDIPIPIKAGIIEYEFVTIHPFWDGNGRTSRLLANYILKAYGYDLKGFYVMEEFYDKNINDYYNSLQMGLHHNFYFGRKDADITEWLEYFISTMANTFEAVGNRVKEIYLNSKEEVNILDTLDKRERWIANYILNNGKIKAKDIASHFKISLNTANNWIKEWLENGFLVRENDKQIRNVDYILTKKYQEKIK